MQKGGKQCPKGARTAGLCSMCLPLPWHYMLQRVHWSKEDNNLGSRPASKLGLKPTLAEPSVHPLTSSQLADVRVKIS